MATLKISDLSIGDWVEYCSRHYKVYSIEECGLIRAKCEDDYTSSHIGKNIDYLEPIPITAEILEKNGFECIEEDVDTVLYGTPSCSIFHTKGTLRYRLDTPQVSVVCWNIHNLQHALRLAGVDKEINL